MNYVETARRLRPLIEKAVQSLSDTEALDSIELFEHWRPDTDVILDQRLQYHNKLYRVVQAHHTQSNWLPDITPALFAEVAKPGEIPVWQQPTGAQDAYMIGDKVHYPAENDPVYECDIDYNVYAPTVYGWHEVT